MEEFYFCSGLYVVSCALNMTHVPPMAFKQVRANTSEGRVLGAAETRTWQAARVQAVRVGEDAAETVAGVWARLTVKKPLESEGDT